MHSLRAGRGLEWQEEGWSGRVLSTVVGHFANWHLIYKKLFLGDHCGLLNYVISLWSLLDGHLTARLHARNL